MKFFRQFDVIKNSRIILIVSCVLVLLGIVSMIVLGFNIDIDFSGGTEVQIDIGREVTAQDCDDINGIVERLFGKQYVSSTTKDLNNTSLAIIRTGTAELTNEQQEQLLNELDTTYGIDHTESKNFQINYISATVGKRLTRTAILSVIIAVACMLVYISFRFHSVDSALAAIFCLVFNSFIMMAVYSIFQIPVDSNIIAALLTILGYSINATIVIFDRIREDKKRYGESKTFAEIVALGTSETMGRSINTTITTLLTILMIYIFGVESIRDFALPLIIGIIAGLFSSVCLSGYVWLKLDQFFGKFKSKSASKKTAKAK